MLAAESLIHLSSLKCAAILLSTPRSVKPIFLRSPDLFFRRFFPSPEPRVRRPAAAPGDSRPSPANQALPADSPTPPGAPLAQRSGAVAGGLGRPARPTPGGPGCPFF